ncbi:MAG: hypothetical protein WDW36_005031 [Sanguina aurantia]
MLCILGDLHLAPDQMHLFEAARAQLVAAVAGLSGGADTGARVVQLGDLGHSKHVPGSRECFQTARGYLDGFGIPSAFILGNHDLEGTAFDNDAENLTAWQDEMGQHHHWVADLGRAVAIGMSTTRFRSNTTSHHEVYVDDAQVAWFERQLEAFSGRPIIVFTHAPPMGCGLRVLQGIHVKNRCAWLNHTDRPERFINLRDRHPDVRMWFSGHFHLSHNYLDSITVVGTTAFVQTGVIGDCNRDGQRQSRLLRGGKEGFQLYTMDHGSGNLRLDLEHRWDDSSSPTPLPIAEELLCDPSGGWLCSTNISRLREDAPSSSWFPVGPSVILAHQSGLLLEYDIATAAPVGVVCPAPPWVNHHAAGPRRQTVSFGGRI